MAFEFHKRMKCCINFINFSHVILFAPVTMLTVFDGVPGRERTPGREAKQW